MARRRSRKTKAKKVSYELIAPQSDVGAAIHASVRELVAAHHDDLKHARWGIAWATAWRPDRDGGIVTTKVVIANDLGRELAPYDLVMLINREWYYHPRTTDIQRRARLDHALQGVTQRFDGNGEPAHDERLRPLYRSVKPDIQEHTVIVERYGCYVSQIEKLAMAIQRAKYGRSPSEWVGAARLREILGTVGLDIPMEEINTWTQDERDDVEQWAQLRIDMGEAPQTIANTVAEPARIAQWRASAALPLDAGAPVEPSAEPVAH